MRFSSDRVIWFEMNQDGRAVLVHPSGKRIEYEENNGFIDQFQTEQGKFGYQRAVLYIKEYGIWDVTAFACSMDTGIVYFRNGSRSDALQCFCFFTPMRAEKAVYPYLSSEQVENCIENLKLLYSDSNLQAVCGEMILYGVTLKFDPQEMTLEPISMSEVLQALQLERGIQEIDSTTMSSISDENLQQLCAEIKYRFPQKNPNTPYTKKWLKWKIENEPEIKAVTFWKVDEINGEFSNWYSASFTEDGVQYHHCEQYMMAKKALMFGDTRAYNKIMKERDPSNCKCCPAN